MTESNQKKINKKSHLSDDADSTNKITESMSTYHDLTSLDRPFHTGSRYITFIRKILHAEIKDWITNPITKKQTNFNKETMNSINHLEQETKNSINHLEQEIHEFEIITLKDQIPYLIDKGESWILRSGILISDKKDPNHGAVYYSYDSKSGFDFIHAESAGYLISFLKYLYSFYKDPELIQLAKTSGNWLIKFCTNYEGIVIMGIRDNIDIKIAYTFDNGICCKAFLDLYELTNDKKYLDCAEKIADWLINDALNTDGSISPEYDFENSKFLESEDSWWRSSGSFHSKITMSLFQLYSINKQERFRESALKICNWCLDQQKSDGSFTANKYFQSVNMHTLSYTIEALLYAYATENRQDYLLAAQKAIDWMLDKQEPDGSFLLYYGDWVDKTKPIYAIAQFVRLLLLVHSITREDRLLNAAIHASKFIMRFQSFDFDKQTLGGFYEHTTSYEFLGKHKQVYAPKFRKNSKLSGFGTMFAIQSLDMLDARISNLKDSSDFKELIKNLF